MNRGTSVLVWILRIVLPCAVVFGAVMLFKFMMESSPEQERKSPEERKVLVETQVLKPENRVVAIDATGTVVPVEEVLLKARVAGEVMELNPRFEPGVIIKKGETIVGIDKVDYVLAQKQAESALVEAEYNYKIELGYQEVAKHEWELLDNKENISQLEKDLTLRKPQLEKVRAGLESAETALEQAKLNLSRTSLTLPFDALVLSRNISLGSQINTQSELGVFVDASLFRVEVTVPFDRLEWIGFPVGNQPGAPVEIRASGGMSGNAVWKGVVSKLVPEIESQGRMVQILIDVKNPMEGDVPLLLNSFVSAEISSRELKNVFVLPTIAVHNGNIVYMVNGESRISFRSIEPLWRDKKWVITDKGFKEGETYITTDVPSAVPNMKVVKIQEPETSGQGDE